MRDAVIFNTEADFVNLTQLKYCMKTIRYEFDQLIKVVYCTSDCI